MKAVFTLTPVLSILLAGASLHADELVRYEFEGNLNDSANHAGILSTSITNGAAYNTDTGYSSYTTPVDGGATSYFARGSALAVTVNSTPSGFPIAQSQGSYLELTLTSTQPMNLTSLTLDAARAASTHRQRALFTADVTGDTYEDRLTILNPPYDGSLENVLQDEYGSLDTAPAGLDSDWGAAMGTTITLSGAEFQGITSVTFRLYSYAINAATPSTNDVIRYDNIVVNGTVVPEPSTYALIAGLGVAALAIYRRRR